MAFIYKTENLINNKIYIGKSKYNNPTYLGSGLRITGAIKKYGKENFAKEILEECNESIVSEREIFWITHYNSTDDITGYNISRGGEGGAHYWETLSEEERAEHNRKISESRKGQKLKPHSQETKIKQANSFWEHAKNNPEFFKERALAKCKKYTCVNHTTNEIYKIQNLREFCDIHNVDFEGMRHNARTRKNLFRNTWSCAFGWFEDLSSVEVIQILADEVNTNNLLYRDKIRQSRKRHSGGV
jgi:group I intron endonuclease